MVRTVKERTKMKKYIFTSLVFLLCSLPCFASSAPLQNVNVNVNVNPQVIPQSIDFNICNKTFKLDTQKLFYLTLASVNANKFHIDEIKSKSGYILFSVAEKQFLASVIQIDAKNSMLKITPCNNIYYFPSGIVQNMFKYIELNANLPIQKLSVS